MRRSGVIAGLSVVVLATALTGCEIRPPYPEWCSALDDWLSDVRPTIVATSPTISPVQRRDLVEELRSHTEAIAEYPRLSTAFAALIGWWEAAAPGDGLADRRVLEEQVWDEFGVIHEACPGPFY